MLDGYECVVSLRGDLEQQIRIWSQFHGFYSNLEQISPQPLWKSIENRLRNKIYGRLQLQIVWGQIRLLGGFYVNCCFFFSAS